MDGTELTHIMQMAAQTKHILGDRYMWVLKRCNEDYYYERYDEKIDLPVYTKDISKAKAYRTKKEAKEKGRFGGIPIKNGN